MFNLYKDASVIFGIFLQLFIVIDPIGNLPLFAIILKKVPKALRIRTIATEMCYSIFLMLFILVTGNVIVVHILKLPIETVYIAGGIVLGAMGYKIVFSGAESITQEDLKEEISVFPITIPLTVGPGVIVMIMMMANENTMIHNIISIFLAWIVTFGFAVSSVFASRFIGENKGIIRGIEFIVGFSIIMIAVGVITSIFPITPIL